jgi:hypothetical protein
MLGSTALCLLGGILCSSQLPDGQTSRASWDGEAFDAMKAATDRPDGCVQCRHLGHRSLMLNKSQTQVASSRPLEWVIHHHHTFKLFYGAFRA